MTPEKIKKTREAHGLTQARCAELACVNLRTWQKWEYGERKMPRNAWELFLRKVKAL